MNRLIAVGDDETDITGLVSLHLTKSNFNKPFSPKELVSRVKAVLRRMEKERMLLWFELETFLI